MRRYLLTDEAQADLAEINDYLKREAGVHVAKSTLTKIKEAFLFLSRTPGAGHVREDLTSDPVRFWSVYSYLIVYDPAKRPIEILHIIHGNREIAAVLGHGN
jgi:plasmid stabilization system protein ParE